MNLTFELCLLALLARRGQWWRSKRNSLDLWRGGLDLASS